MYCYIRKTFINRKQHLANEKKKILMLYSLKKILFVRKVFFCVQSKQVSIQID